MYSRSANAATSGLFEPIVNRVSQITVSDSIFAGITAGAQFGGFCPMERFSPVLSRCILCGARRVPTGAGREKRSESIRHSTTVGAVSGEAGAAFVFFGPCFGDTRRLRRIGHPDGRLGMCLLHDGKPSISWKNRLFARPARNPMEEL
jgi:hypothetical protein